MNSFQPLRKNPLNLSSSPRAHMHALPPRRLTATPPPPQSTHPPLPSFFLFPSPFSEEGDTQALANLKGFQKQYLRSHASHCWF